MSDNSNTGMPEDDKKTSALLALLYPDEGAEAGESDPGLDDELSSMQTLRSLFKDMPEEEPSDAISNKLLAMAAQHAPTPKSESKGLFGWFSDLLMPLVAHPGLAAAATLVLVVGVAGTLYVKGAAQMAQPQVASRAEAPEAPAAVATPTAQPSEDPSALYADEDQGIGEVMKDSVAAEGDAEEERSEAQAPGDKAALSRDFDRRDAKSGPDKSRAKRGGATEKGNLSGAIGGLNQAVATGSSDFGSGGGGASSSGRRVTGITDAPSSEPAPESKPKPEPAPVTSSTSKPRESKSAPAPRKPSAQPKKSTKSGSSNEVSGADFAPPPPSAPAEDADDDASKEAPQKKEEQKKSGPSASDLHKQAVRAANNGDCKRALELGNQIRKIDSAYYDRTFLSDAKIKACRAALK